MNAELRPQQPTPKENNDRYDEAPTDVVGEPIYRDLGESAEYDLFGGSVLDEGQQADMLDAVKSGTLKAFMARPDIAAIGAVDGTQGYAESAGAAGNVKERKDVYDDGGVLDRELSPEQVAGLRNSFATNDGRSARFIAEEDRLLQMREEAGQISGDSEGEDALELGSDEDLEEEDYSDFDDVEAIQAAETAVGVLETTNAQMEADLGVVPEVAEEVAQEAEEVVAKTLWQRIKTEGLFSSLRKVMSGDHRIENAVAGLGITAEERQAAREALDDQAEERFFGGENFEMLEETEPEMVGDTETPMPRMTEKAAAMQARAERASKAMSGSIGVSIDSTQNRESAVSQREASYEEVSTEVLERRFMEFGDVMNQEAQASEELLEGTEPEMVGDTETPMPRMTEKAAAMQARAERASKAMSGSIGVSIDSNQNRDSAVSQREVATEAITAADLDELMAESPTTTVENIDATVEVEYDPTVAGVMEFVQDNGGTVAEGGLRFTLKIPIAGEPYVQVYLAKTSESVTLNQGRVNWLLENGYALGTAAQGRSAEMPNRVWEQFVQETEPEAVSASSLEAVEEEPTQVVATEADADAPTTLIDVEGEPAQMVDEDLPTEEEPTEPLKNVA